MPGRESLTFNGGFIKVLHFRPKSAFHFEIFMNGCQGIDWQLLWRLVFLSIGGSTIEIGWSSFCISLYSFILTILSKLSSRSLLVFFLDAKRGTSCFSCWRHQAACCRASADGGRSPAVQVEPCLGIVAHRYENWIQFGDASWLNWLGFFVALTERSCCCGHPLRSIINYSC